ncbi:DUF3349 domain-containing protein [Rhodococcus maanshanensis]|uniref:DUF3349 domain-containing protein n=1 Tax=Rhodococcus maanshanensis TaxID=183556 RepID=A0A1H7JJE2_9NOCA|nr:DUF3349 domain-containing protein [Rhodococcus maanshanensis]SEK74818.1 Protein of unknown function [Rhodococcus maanshanensis]
MALPPFLTSILGWLRAGYPNGVPEQDYIPLIALLRRRLSDEEVHAVTDALVEQFPPPIDKIDIQVLITKVTDEMPTESDVERVRAHLAAGGWPLADEPGDGPNGAATLRALDRDAESTAEGGASADGDTPPETG